VVELPVELAELAYAELGMRRQVFATAATASWLPARASPPRPLISPPVRTQRMWPERTICASHATLTSLSRPDPYRKSCQLELIERTAAL
jgi:hypothetical protein